MFTKCKIGQDNVSTITPWYLLYKFHSIIPNIEVSGVSTAREPQAIALCCIDTSLIVDRSCASKYTIHFSIGNSMLISTITVPTPIRTIIFYVVLACTLFLLRIQDIDQIGIHLDNTWNILVQGQKTVPIIRKFGHPFLLLHPHETLAFCHLTELELHQIY